MKRKRTNPFSLFSFQDIITGLCGIMIFFVLIMIVELATSRSAASTPESTQTNDEAKIAQLQERISDLRDEFSELQSEMQELDVLRKVALTETERYALKKKKKAQHEENLELKQEIDALREDYIQKKTVYDTTVKKLKQLTQEKKTLEQIEREMKETEPLIGVTYIPERATAKRPVFVVCDCEGVKVFLQTSVNGRYDERNFDFETLLVDFRQFLKTNLNAKRDSLVFLIRPSGLESAQQLVAIGKENNFSIGRDPLEEEAIISFGGR